MSDPLPPPPPAPPRRMGLIRWKALLPTAALIGGTAFALRFFLDGIVERAVETYGARANGAKVELDGVAISFLKTSVTFRRLQVADAENPMTNALEVERLNFKLAPKPLAWKKIIVEDASITGIRTGTPRKHSGALPRPAAKPSDGGKAAEPDMADKAKEAASFALGNLKEQYDPKKLVQLDDLESYKKIREEQVHYQAIADTWEARVDALKSSDVDGRAKAFVERVKTEDYSGLEGIVKAKKDLDEAKKLKDDAAALKKGFESLKTDVTAEIARAKDTLKGIDDLKRRDLDGALKDLKANFSAEGVTRGLVGPQWFGKLKSTLGYVNKARAMVPAKKAAEKPEPPRERKGRDIPFPFRHDWPAFHLLKASLSGATEGGLDYEGSLKDVTSDPAKVGRPILLDVAGKKAPRAMAFKATLDYTKDTPRERIQASHTGLPLAGTKLGDVGGAVTIKSGAGAVTADVALKGEALSGEVRFDAAPVTLDHAGKGGNKLMDVLHDVLTRVNRLDVAVRLSDTITSPNFTLETSLDGQIKDALKQALQKELDDIKAQARARLDELVDGERKKLADQIDGKAGGALKKLGLKDKQVQGVDAQVQKLLDDLKKKSAQSILPAGDGGKPQLPGDLKKLFKKK